LIGNAENKNSRYCFAKKGEVYLVFLPTGGSMQIDLNEANRKFTVRWFNPRTGGGREAGSVQTVDVGKSVSLGNPPHSQEED